MEFVPDWIAIVGSGYIGLEFSDVYTALGSEVTPHSFLFLPLYIFYEMNIEISLRIKGLYIYVMLQILCLSPEIISTRDEDFIEVMLLYSRINLCCHLNSNLYSLPTAIVYKMAGS